MARKCSTRYRRGSRSGWWRDKPHFHNASDILAISALYSCEEETRSEKMTRLSGSASILSEETHPFLRPRDHHQGWQQPALTEEATKGDLQIQQPNAHHNVAWEVTTVNWASRETTHETCGFPSKLPELPSSQDWIDPSFLWGRYPSSI